MHEQWLADEENVKEWKKAERNGGEEAKAAEVADLLSKVTKKK